MTAFHGINKIFHKSTRKAEQLKESDFLVSYLKRIFHLFNDFDLGYSVAS